MAPGESLDEAPNQRDQPVLRKHGRWGAHDVMPQINTKSPLNVP